MIKMNILSHHEPNSRIEVMQPSGNLTGANVYKLRDWLFTCMYENRYLQLIDFELVSEIDKHGLFILNQMLDRGMYIRLFNVPPVLKWMIRMQKGLHIKDKIYHATIRDKAVLMFAKELLEISKNKTANIKSNLRRRCYNRANVSVSIEFKYFSSNKKMVFCKALTKNISVGGLFAGQLKSINMNIEKLIKKDDIVGKILYGLKFALPSCGLCIETKGECVRHDFKNDENYLGIRFDDMTQYQEEILMATVYDNSV